MFNKTAQFRFVCHTKTQIRYIKSDWYATKSVYILQTKHKLYYVMYISSRDKHIQSRCINKTD